MGTGGGWVSSRGKSWYFHWSYKNSGSGMGDVGVGIVVR